MTEKDTYIAYETNVTNIDNVITSFDDMKLDFENDGGDIRKEECSLRKYDNTSLYIICSVHEEGNYFLKEITEEKIYNNINVKYNFRIQPIKNTEKIYFEIKDGTAIIWLYPQIMNFTEKDTCYIKYSTEVPKYFNGITFNEDAEDLNCEILQNRLKRCIVPKSHFKGKTSGYYFTKHTNHLDTKSTNYEGSPVRVILDDSPAYPSVEINIERIYSTYIG